MSAMRLLSLLLFALTLVAAGAMLLQRQAAAELRGEIALLREEGRELIRLHNENARLVTALPVAARLEAMRADHAAVLRLRSEIEMLKVDTDRQARESGIK